MANLKNLVVLIVNNAPEIEALVKDGFCPVECSIGGKSITDELMMDHHGELSHLESVAIRAYRDNFGARANDPRFVICGSADADATFCVAALAGLIPHPSRIVDEKLPAPVQAGLKKDFSFLAETVARVDTSPIGLDIPSLPGGDILLTWNGMTTESRDSLGAMAGVGMWRNLLQGNPALLGPYLAAAKTSEETRRIEALRDLDERGTFIDGILVIKESRTFGFPEWYGRKEDQPFEDPTGWENPVVISYIEGKRNVTMGAPNNQVAEKLLGQGGLKNVFPHLPQEGWGGRESIGGSPRGAVLSWEDVEQVAKAVATVIASNKVVANA